MASQRLKLSRRMAFATIGIFGVLAFGLGIKTAYPQTKPPTPDLLRVGRDCLNAKPLQAIVACTALIVSGRIQRAALAEAYSRRGLAYYSLGQNARAIVDFDQVIKLKPNDVLAYVIRGDGYGLLGQHARAIVDIDQVIKLRPDFAGAYNARGDEYSSLGQYARAIVDFDRAIWLKPDFADAYYNRGVACAKLGKSGLAAADKAKAHALDPVHY